VTLIGGSFVHDVARILIAQGCLRGLQSYSYLVGTIRGGEDYLPVREGMSPTELRTLRNSDIVILEENEATLAGAGHAVKFGEIILGE
jgi:hypothetical protein